MIAKKISEEGCIFCGLTSLVKNTNFAHHMEEAKKELWLAIRTLIDSRIESLGEKEKDDKPAKKVKIG
ncbi:MAG: hypothetical protein SCARUB_00848 [Candidatus Scalindua rubra]|uniref:Uncharacterized protein n=1 Tax=Candidatus Scalindua rubra TaxID=1872076 RepID=A0A1E3XEB1_9BACT|nr:MAG: hypothetical protein SCARUB_00848 [Candidatus Scalindua rubra]